MCGGYGNEDSNNDGKVSIGDFFTDITDGGGAGYSGARFGGGTGSNVLDVNNDRYVSEAEYMRGQKAHEANQREGIGDGRFGNAYRDSQNIISNFSNSFGALPRGSIRQEAALFEAGGPEYGSPIETKNMARFLQDFAGDARDMAMAPVRAYRGEGAPPDPVGTPEQQARSYDSILNTGSSQFDKLPKDRRDAIIRGTQSLNAKRALQIKMAQAAARQQPQTATVEDYLPVENGMVEVIYSNGIRKRMTLQQARNQARNNGIAL